MPDVNFYLKKAEGTPPVSLVYLQMRYHGRKFVYSCKFSVSKANWDDKKQVVKTRTQTTEDGSIHLNTRLKDMREICLKAYNTESANGIPENNQLKPYLDAYMNQNANRQQEKKSGPTLFKLIDNFISGDVGDKKTEGTIDTYRTALKHLQGFEKREGYPVDFHTVTLDFKYKYTKYLSKERGNGKEKEKALSPNSIAKEIKNVRTFMNMAVELGFTTNLAYKSKKFRVKGEETDAVYLTENEIRDLYKHDFSYNKRLEAVRDLFVFNSFVGLRYSDASNIKPENVVKMDGEYYIKIIPIKTKKPVTIPCNDIVLDIFKKYDHNKNRLPPSISNQKYNEYLKVLAKEAGLTEIGRLTSDLNKPLYDCLSSHTGRRNFATNCYLSGMDIPMIMLVTGHKTEKSFMAYIKVTREENAKKMSEYMKKELSQRSLKVAG